MTMTREQEIDLRLLRKACFVILSTEKEGWIMVAET
jgi:hypothetical protein